MSRLEIFWDRICRAVGNLYPPALCFSWFHSHDTPIIFLDTECTSRSSLLLSSLSIEQSMLPLKYPWSNRWGKAQKISNNPNPFDIYRIFMADDGEFPNNRDYPALLYKDAFDGTEAEGRDLIAGDDGWTDPWVGGIFSYHHYHTKAWELLLCTGGSASAQFGGDGGPIVAVGTGDLILIPPGIAHIQLDVQNKKISYERI
mmetsp:Transcript_2948/g.4565  ORF Transcript_2948/g.4565 Transcript_2948/m.4565 type:complete len:201 (-) Transcript_2948:251-853(-)